MQVGVLGGGGSCPSGSVETQLLLSVQSFEIFFSTGPVHGPPNNKRLSSVNRGVCISYMLEKKVVLH